MDVCTGVLIQNQKSLQNLQSKSGIAIEEQLFIPKEFLSLSESWNKEAGIYMGSSHISSGLLSSDDLNFELLKSNTTGIVSENNSLGISEEEVVSEKIRPKNKMRSEEFQPVTEEEFATVSELVRKRSKLEEVNRVYETIFNHFKKNKSSKPLTLQKLTSMGVKVSGATGDACVQTLRTLKLIQISKIGISIPCII